MQLKNTHSLLYILKCEPEDRSCSQESQHSSSAAELKPRPTASLGFCTVLHFLVHMTASMLQIFQLRLNSQA